ncbi:MAG: hypothetical protein M4579_006889, partial [Chaenotheca gracillima]
MEAALGVIALAGSVLQGIKDLHDFCNSVKDAPEDVRCILDELWQLESYLEILGEIEPANHKLANRGALEKSKSELEKISLFLKELNLGSNCSAKSRRWNSFTAILRKKERIEKFEKR